MLLWEDIFFFFFFALNSCFSFYQTIRQKILDLLNPLTGHLGVQLIAAVATVWSRKQARRHSKTKVRSWSGLARWAQCTRCLLIPTVLQPLHAQDKKWKEMGRSCGEAQACAHSQTGTYLHTHYNHIRLLQGQPLRRLCCVCAVLPLSSVSFQGTLFFWTDGPRGKRVPAHPCRPGVCSQHSADRLSAAAGEGGGEEASADQRG